MAETEMDLQTKEQERIARRKEKQEGYRKAYEERKKAEKEKQEAERQADKEELERLRAIVACIEETTMKNPDCVTIDTEEPETQKAQGTQKQPETVKLAAGIVTEYVPSFEHLLQDVKAFCHGDKQTVKCVASILLERVIDEVCGVDPA